MAISHASHQFNEIGCLCTQHGQIRLGGRLKPLHVACTMDRQGGAARSSNATRRHAKPQTASQNVVAPLPSMQEAEGVALSRQSSPQAEQHRALHSLAELFPPQHVEGLHPGLLLYFPLGCVVAALRMAVWTVLILLDSEWLTNNYTSIEVLLFLLGIDVRWHSDALIPMERHVLVSNHVSTGDLMMLYKRPKRYVHIVAPGLPQRVTEVQNHRISMKVACKDTFMKLCDADLHDSIHIFPEGGMTNGRGMMRFSRGFMTFAKRLPVVPVALRACLPWGLHTHTLTSSFAANMFWFCFSPWVRLDATVLPPMRFTEGEQKGKFVARVQTVIADELDIPVSDITIQRKREVVKLARKLDQV